MISSRNTEGTISSFGSLSWNSIELIGFEYAVPENIDGLKECIQRLHFLSNNYIYNYSIGETMEFASNKWLSFAEMMKLISTMEFMNTGVGDIYAKNFFGK